MPAFLLVGIVMSMLGGQAWGMQIPPQLLGIVEILAALACVSYPWYPQTWR